MNSGLPVRLIICVDGTWCSPDGPHGKRNQNVTNIYRFHASIKKGVCNDGFYQEKEYFSGIAAEDGIGYGERLFAGMLGTPCIEQISNVYEYICKSTGPEDEVWLYGFSRGAYVVRAVAGLLHYLRAIRSAGEACFKKDFDLALKVYKKMQQEHRLDEAAMHHMFEAKTRPAPTIQFVGLFDTVKVVQDKRLYDISFNPSIQHLRHALALNEDRQRFEPEYIYPDFTNRTQRLEKRSFVQAWFVGAHMDIGGSTDRDGLSLYPLQWMLIESKNHGLNLEFDGNFGNRTTLDNPLTITGLDRDNEQWKCKTKNKIVIHMKDIRKFRKFQESKGKYGIRLHRSRGSWIRRHREPFGERGEINGYCNFGAQGTIIHPSVYLVLDEFVHISLSANEFPFYQLLQQWRSKSLGQQDDLRAGCFWDGIRDLVDEDPGAFRILVCGNCGVGKSSLINKVFGNDDLAKVAHGKPGEHEIKTEITCSTRKDLVVHDSGGFEAGSEEQLNCVKEFLKKRAAHTDFHQRLHVIWYCFEVKDHERLIQAAQTSLFKCLSEFAQDVPIVAIATKKDQFLGIKANDGKRYLKERHEPVTLEAMEAYAEQELENTLCDTEKRLKAVGRFDAFVAVSTDDDASFDNLIEVTMELLGEERLTLLFLRAQATRLDLKVELARLGAMKIYKNILWSSSTVGGLPTASTTNRTGAAIDVCRTIVVSFGISSISPNTIYEIVKANLWDDFGSNIRTTMAELSAILGLALTIFSGGIPFFLIPMGTNIPLVVLATARLVLMLTCDVILILTLAFREATLKSIAKPDRHDVENAAVEYRKHCHEVHRRIKEVLPHFLKCYKISHVQTSMTKIIEEFKCKVLEGVGAPLPRNFRRDYSDTIAPSASLDSSDDSDDGGSSIVNT
ncbi:hypothetical protein H9Q70_005517 [Fusarium xylarioides]|nr:hypothetical protein H9Q70_005517 [Fusarium xylarioides]KAG5783462.1 hypothetical protein H9Q73_002880 [Fusarium xylarioides]